MSQTQHCHPLDNPGTSQIGRLIQALLPETFQIDERSIQDLIVEAYKFAKTLHFYDIAANAPSGSHWEGFWEVEILTYLAVLSVKDTDAQLNGYRRLVDAFKTGNATANKGEEAPSPYQPLLEQLRDMAVELEQSYQKLQRINHPLQDLLLHRIRRENVGDREELQGALARLISYHKGAVDELDPKGYQAFLLPDGRWGLRGRVDYDAISAQPNFNLEDLEEIFASFYDTWLILKTEAQKSFDAELARMERPQAEEYRVVQPHIALFLVFLRLFRYAQESLNELGAKHLDYYYQEILGIQAQAAVPDEVYLIFELAKDFNQHVVEKGTPLLGGKDANGRPLIYQTAEDWVVRAAKVADIKTTWIDRRCGGIHAQPDVNKVYELGEERPNETAESWRSMGDDPHLPTAELGFAIASPQLILREGERNITVVLQLCQALSETANMRADYFKLYLSSTEEWVSLVPETSMDADSARGTFDMTFSDRQIKLNIKLERDAPPIDHLGEDLAEAAGMDTRWPILKVAINPELKKPCPAETAAPLTAAEVYANLQPLVVEEATITVDVKGIRENLIIQSDEGVFDGTQKVYPFGPTPQIGNRFYIGSTEVFQKALDDLVVRFKWIAPPESVEDYYQEYADLGTIGNESFAVPSPQVLIDFIDKADGRLILLTQVDRSGRLDEPNNDGSFDIRLRISDVNLNHIATASIAEDSLGALGYEAEDEIYTLTYPAGQNAPTVTFEVPEEDFEPLEVDLAENGGLVAALNIVLFPKLLLFSKVPDTGFMLTGRVLNAFGELIDAFELQLPTGSDFEFSNGIYESLVSAPPSSLQFKEHSTDPIGLGPVSIDNTIIRSTRFDTVLLLEEPEIDDSNSFDGDLSGRVLRASNDRLPIQNGDVYIEAVGSDGVLLRTKSNEDGTYQLSGLLGANHLIVYYGNNKAEQRKLNVPSSDAELDIYLSPKSVSTIAPQQLTVKIDLDVPYPSNGASPPVVTLHIDGEEEGVVDYSSTIERTVNFGAKLKFEADGYEDLDIEANRYSTMALKLLPANGSSQLLEEETADDGSVEVLFLNLQPIPGKLLVKNANEELNFEINDRRITIDYDGNIDTINIYHPGYAELTILGVNDTQYYEAIMQPSFFISDENVGNDEIKVGAVAADGEAVTVRITGGGYQVETEVEGEGAYTFRLPENAQGQSYKVTAFQTLGDGSILYTDYWGGALGQAYNLPLLDRASMPPATRVRGIVRSSRRDTIRGVRVSEVGTDNSTQTSSSGYFELEIAPGAQLDLFHPAYQALRVEEISQDFALDVTLLPLEAYFVIEGQVQDVFESSLGEVSISLSIDGDEETLYHIGGVSDSTGDYRVIIPVAYADQQDTRIHFERGGYEKVVMPLPHYSEVEDSDIDLSSLTVRMRSDDINYTPLIENDTLKQSFNVKINALSLVRDVRTQEFEAYSPTLKRGFIRFTLDRDDFMHRQYPKILTWYALYAAGQIPLIDTTDDDQADRYTGQSTETPPIPNPPYTPATNNISLDYTSTQVITGEANDGIDQFYHLLPFNGHRAVALSPEQQGMDYTGVQLIYPYTPADSDAFRYTKDCENNGQVVAATSYAEGHLYIGLSNLTPGGTLSLLFTLAKGSAPSPEASAPELYWSYLVADNQWLPFQPGEILKDSTNGLTRTGMMQFQIPTTAVSENTMLNPSLYWIQASAKVANGEAPDEDVRALPSLSDIHAQVVLARFANDDNELSHLGDPLPADTISNLVEGNIAVKKIAQPLPSFGGRLPEQAGHEFMRRVSERLRHKDRAVSRWDYEHLLLQAFNEVQRAKCIPHTRYRPWEKASESAPGFVSVAVIPRLDGRTGHALAEPRFTQGKLDDMATHLAQRANLFVAFGEKAEARLQVVNPLYEKVDVKVKVAFQPGDEVYFKQQLTEALTHYISPWLADASTPPVFDRTLDKSAILQFVEEQPYVDYVELEGNTFVIRKTMTDLAGRPLAEKELRTLEEKVHGTANEVEVRTVRSQEIDGKVCTRSERSILIAGTVYVNSTKDAADKDLPAMPREIVELNGSGTKQPVEEEPVQQLVVAVKATGTASRGSRRKTTAKSSKATGKTASKRPAKGRKSKAGTSKKGSTSSRQPKKKSTRKKKGDSDS